MKRIFLADRFGEQEYTVNGVRYIVSSSFQTAKLPDNTTIHDRLKRIITNSVVELPIEETDVTMAAEYVCSAAGKEET